MRRTEKYPGQQEERQVRHGRPHPGDLGQYDAHRQAGQPGQSDGDRGEGGRCVRMFGDAHPPGDDVAHGPEQGRCKGNEHCPTEGAHAGTGHYPCADEAQADGGPPPPSDALAEECRCQQCDEDRPQECDRDGIGERQQRQAGDEGEGRSHGQGSAQQLVAPVADAQRAEAPAEGDEQGQGNQCAQGAKGHDLPDGVALAEPLHGGIVAGEQCHREQHEHYGAPRSRRAQGKDGTYHRDALGHRPPHHRPGRGRGPAFGGGAALR